MAIPFLLVLLTRLCHGVCSPAAPCRITTLCSLEELRAMPDWTEDTPLRVVTGYQNLATRFFKEKGFKHVVLLSGDGALEVWVHMTSESQK